jgi:hypothetical protein
MDDCNNPVKKCNIVKPSAKQYNCRGCYNNLSGNDPASQYQRLKLIQNTVRVPSSIYTMNLGSLTVYQAPDMFGVNWNQMSDRKDPHTQKAFISMKSSKTIKPGNLTPGGVGCDIKHNSYDRYLNRLKGKAPLRRGVIPPDFGVPFIPFNRAFPIYGGKTTKTSIINNCNCGPKVSI